jgi:prepilin-type N-terminal cleavage/methylation domain-containing protein
MLRSDDRIRSPVHFVTRRRAAAESPSPKGRRIRAFTLIELIVVIAILSLIVLVVPLNLFGALLRHTFKAQMQEFISAMQMAASAAAEGGGRYEMTIDLGAQSYLLRRISGSNLADVLEEEIITTGRFGDRCHASYVEFDDGDYTNDSPAKFRVSHAGWHYGGKIVFLDESEQPHTVVVTRLSPVVDLVEGDPPLLRPKTKEEMPFR